MYSFDGGRCSVYGTRVVEGQPRAPPHADKALLDTVNRRAIGYVEPAWEVAESMLDDKAD